MRAAKGAIEDFSIDPTTYRADAHDHRQCAPQRHLRVGADHRMWPRSFEMGVINNQGKFERELGYRADPPDASDIWEYVLAYADETQIDRDVVISEIDIENLIRAKGAIYSGCMTLLAEVGMGIGRHRTDHYWPAASAATWTSRKP
jgi:uncharacterized 2Fe-2S/4Fe-4S cluster protein (DUF4445 family)